MLNRLLCAEHPVHEGVHARSWPCHPNPIHMQSTARTQDQGQTQKRCGTLQCRGWTTGDQPGALPATHLPMVSPDCRQRFGIEPGFVSCRLHALSFSLHSKHLPAHLQDRLKAFTASLCVLPESIDGVLFDSVFDLLPSTTQCNNLGLLIECSVRVWKTT